MSFDEQMRRNSAEFRRPRMEEKGNIPLPKYRVVRGEGHEDLEAKLNALAEIGYRVIASYLHYHDDEGWAVFGFYAVMELKEA